MPDPQLKRRSSGFTLIEALVIIATVGIIAAVAISTYQRVQGLTPPHNAAKDLAKAMERARALAVESKSDVWMVVYPGFNRRANTTNAGRGAYFVIQDVGHDFNAPSGTAPNVYYRAGVGQELDPINNKVSGPNAKLIESVYLEDYGGRIRFRLPNARMELTEHEAPFKGLVVTASCTFCTAGSRGAIIFGADQSVKFVDGSGNALEGEAKAHALTLISDRGKRTSIVALSGTPWAVGAFVVK